MLIQLTVSDTIKDRVIDAYATQYRYQPTINGQPNPQSKAAFTKAQIINQIKSVVKTVEANKQVELARSQTMTKVDSEILIS